MKNSVTKEVSSTFPRIPLRQWVAKQYKIDILGELQKEKLVRYFFAMHYEGLDHGGRTKNYMTMVEICPTTSVLKLESERILIYTN